MKKRKIEITVESDEVLVIKQRGSLNRDWCASCRKQVAVTSLTDAYRFGLTLETARRQVESGQIHLIEKVGSLSFICLDSLVRAVSIDQTADPHADSIHKILNQFEREED